jgi:hypothetical protein
MIFRLSSWFKVFLDARNDDQIASECCFLYKHGLLGQNLEQCPSRLAPLFALLTMVQEQSELIIVGIHILLIISTVLLLEQKAISVIYLASPLIVVTSMTTKLRHLCMTLLITKHYLHSRFKIYIFVVTYILLCILNPEYILYLPVITFISSNLRGSEKRAPAIAAITVALCSLLLVFIEKTTSSLSILGFESLFLEVTRPFALTGYSFRPALGVVWYLHALVLSGYEAYFQTLCILVCVGSSVMLMQVLSEKIWHPALVSQSIDQICSFQRLTGWNSYLV